MTFTSFNTVQLNQIENNTANQPLAIKQGQVFHGTIKKLYPDQTAEVQIGNHKMIAKLEVPLKAGDSYFLQVKSVNPQIELSLISNTTANISPQEQISQLIESMNLPKSADVQQLLKFFIKNQIPIVKEQLQEAIQWFKNLPQGVSKQEALLALQKMIDNKMPFQQNVFQSLIFGLKTSGILQNIESFTTHLNQEETIPNEVKMAITSTLQKVSTPLEGEMGGQLLKRAIQTLQNNIVNTETKLAMLNLLKEANILPKSATLQNWQTESFSQITNQPNQLNHHASQIVQMLSSSNEVNINQTIESAKVLIQNQQLLQQNQKNELLNLLNRFQNITKDSKSIEQFARVFHQKLIEVFSENTNNQLFSIDKNGVTAKEHLLSLLKQPDGKEQLHSNFINLIKHSNESNDPIIQRVYNEAEQVVQSALDGKAMQYALRTVLKSLGLSYEAMIQKSDIETIANTLKPQLLSLVQNSEVSQNVKDSAEVLLSRFNGMQLASNMENHQHQLIMQVPLQFFGKKIDATVQWNGRMKDDGKIDANFARILFYLNMETLEETVIDMQVQNRIVTIQLYNHTPNLEQFAEPLKKSLKEGLSQHNYHLSGIFFKQFKGNDNEQTENKKKEVVEHVGVDIRI